MRLAKYSLAVLIFGFAPLARAQDLVAAHDFVAGLYAAYHGKGPDYLGRSAKAAFSPQLLRLIRRAADATPADEVGALDGDPICDCQDSGGIRMADLKLTAGSRDRATATVRLRFPNEFRTLRLDLIAVDGHWRVGDVHTKDTPSLVAYLTQSLRKPH
jgi:hypothetical protein